MQPSTKVSMPSSRSPDRWARAAARATSLSTQPSSASGTNSAQARPMTRASGRWVAMARAYAWLLIVAAVPMTPMTPFRVARQATSAPGPMTPTTGIAADSRSAGSATADIVLQATTSAFTPRRVRNRAPSRAYRVTVSSDLVP